MVVVDGHEDLAWNMLTFGRDYTLPVAETRRREAGSENPSHNGDTMLGWDEWVRGRVGVIFATLFVAPVRRKAGDWDSQCYADSQQAHRLCSAQLDLYHRLADERPDRFRLILNRDDLKQVLSGWEDDPALEPRLGLVLLMEGADAVRTPSELEMWYERGVRMVGPAWMGTRYAGGTHEPGPFTSEGLALMEVMADLGIVLDLSHLTEEGARQAIDRFDGDLIASHCVPGALIPNSQIPERHLSDQVIRGLAERQGVMGVVLGNKFLKDGWQPSDGREGVTMDHVANCIDYVCQLVGDADHVGIGSDFDGGFGLQSAPTGLDSVAELQQIGDALRPRGYSAEEIEGVLGANWLRVLRRTLPES
ncbi:MAG: membrane dipeptidase [Anaerolineales bacterium]|jgi:membrane dipeptidase